jgi:transcriptional regulator with XRE-family HTH domain
VADRFSLAVGQTLREARREQGLTLREVEARSRGRFKPSVLGGYERGERGISLRRFCELSALYRIPPDRLLARALDRLNPQRAVEVVLDLNRLNLVEEPERRAVTEFVRDIRARRGDFGSEVITLRAGDVEVIAYHSRLDPRTLLRRLEPALRRAPERAGSPGAEPGPTASALWR